MLMPRFTVCAVPRPIWQPEAVLAGPLLSLQEVVLDARAIEYRLTKEVNLERERSRYLLCCSIMERICLDYAVTEGPAAEFHVITSENRQLDWSRPDVRPKFPCIRLGIDYLRLMMEARLDPDASGSPAQMRAMRLGASFFAPSASEPPRTNDDLPEHLDRFREWTEKAGIHQQADVQRRVDFLGKALGEGYGVIEVQDVFGSDCREFSLPRKQRATIEGARWVSGAMFDDTQPLGDSQRAKMEANLKQQINDAVAGRGKVNMNNQPHEVTIQVLAPLVIVDPHQEPVEVPIVYADGSKADPFPLRCLQSGPVPEGRKVKLRAAMMSMRHLALDREVDFAWYRNREVSQSRSLADSDRFCFEYSKKRLAELEIASGGKQVVLELYHTGFEPAVIGFYRALVLNLRDRPGKSWITVTPQFFRGDDRYEAGTVWPFRKDV